MGVEIYDHKRRVCINNSESYRQSGVRYICHFSCMNWKTPGVCYAPSISMERHAEVLRDHMAGYRLTCTLFICAL